MSKKQAAKIILGTAFLSLLTLIPPRAKAEKMNEDRIEVPL
jgi:hypothetical protein